MQISELQQCVEIAVYVCMYVCVGVCMLYTMAAAKRTYKHHTTTPNPRHTKSLVQAVKMVSFELMRISAATCRTVLHKAHHH